MSIRRFNPGGSPSTAHFLAAILSVNTQAELRKRLREDDVFEKALEAVISSKGGDPRGDIRALATEPSYFKRHWTRLKPMVADKLAQLQAAQQQQLETARRDRGVQVLLAQLTESLGIRGEETTKHLAAWIRSHHVSPQTSDRPYYDISVAEDFSQMQYAGSFQRVLLRHLWACVPRDFDVVQYLEWVRSGRYRDSFVWLCGVLEKEIEEDQRGLEEARSRLGAPEEDSWVDAEAVRAAIAFEDEWRRKARARGILPAHPDYGLLNAAVTEQVIQRFRGRLNDFVPSLHAEQLAREVLQTDAKRSRAASFEGSRYLGERAREVVAAFNGLLSNDLPWAAAVDEHVRKAVRDGSLEGYQIMLAFDRNLERWRSGAKR